MTQEQYLKYLLPDTYERKMALIKQKKIIDTKYDLDKRTTRLSGAAEQCWPTQDVQDPQRVEDDLARCRANVAGR